ncbi:MAG: hypothetical protein JW818_07085 [Pirellulales bacterium]|nr:hypothetical protein [Pirellulales bacterium]
MADIIEALCRLPIDYHAIGTKTLIQLMEDAGYFENTASANESAIASCLKEHSDYCDEWIGYSQDRRTFSGWVISERNGVFSVFYHPNGSTTLDFTEKASACAAFMVRELKSLARYRE